MTPEELLDEHTASVAALAAQLRSMLLRLMPDAEERVYTGWHGIGYVHPDAGYVCGIFPTASTVRLLLEHGHLLDDPDGLFSGGGNQVRHIEVSPGQAIPESAIADLLADAIELRARR